MVERAARGSRARLGTDRRKGHAVDEGCVHARSRARAQDRRSGRGRYSPGVVAPALPDVRSARRSGEARFPCRRRKPETRSFSVSQFAPFRRYINEVPRNSGSGTSTPRTLGRASTDRFKRRHRGDSRSPFFVVTSGAFRGFWACWTDSHRRYA